MKHTRFWRVAALLGAGFVGVPSTAIEHMVLDIVENDPNNNATSVTVTKRSGTPNVAPHTSGHSKGDYVIAVNNPSDGGSFNPADDIQHGIFLTGVYQLFSAGSTLGPGGVPDIRVSAPAIHPNIVATTGEFQYFWIANFDSPGGAEWNADVTAVYSPLKKAGLPATQSTTPMATC